MMLKLSFNLKSLVESKKFRLGLGTPQTIKNGLIALKVTPPFSISSAIPITYVSFSHPPVLPRFNYFSPGNFWNYFLLIALVVICFFPLQGHTQVITAIVPDTTLPTNSSVTQIGKTVQIIDGTSVGSNLFHSFDTFHVGSGDTANFVNPGGIDNILSRVTGGAASNIFGTLQSESSANLFFLNPNGVVFGPTASVDVGGSFYVSTADYMRLEDDSSSGFFSATNPATDILTIAPPSAFGFLEQNPNSMGIILNQTMLGVPAGKDLKIGRAHV